MIPGPPPEQTARKCFPLPSESDQRVIRCGRLLLEHVERRARDLAFTDGRAERALVN